MVGDRAAFGVLSRRSGNAFQSCPSKLTQVIVIVVFLDVLQTRAIASRVSQTEISGQSSMRSQRSERKSLTPRSMLADIRGGAASILMTRGGRFDARQG